MRLFSRREFLKSLAVGGAAAGSASLFTACGQTSETGRTADETEMSGETIPVATFTELRVGLEDMYEAQYVWMGDQIYYLEDYQYDNGWVAGDMRSYSGMVGMCSRLMVQSVDGTGETAVLDETEGRYICALFEGMQGNLAMIITEYREEEEAWKYYLTQTDLEGKELSRTELSGMEETAAYIIQAAMDSEGNVAYIESRLREESVNLYAEAWCHLILADGTCVNDLEIGNGNVSADMSVLKLGETDLYLTEQYSSFTSSHKELMIWQIDFSERKLKQTATINASTIMSMTTEGMRILTDGAQIYLTMELYLYLCDLESGEQEEILSWTGEFVNVDGAKISAIRTTEEGYEALLSVDTDPAKLVNVTWTDSSLLSAKETIIIATASGTSLNSVVRRFNESSLEYHAELKAYTASELSDDLIYRSDIVPDLFDTRHVDVTVLEGLNLLEDLEPYFEVSDVVSREDILDTVWEAGMVNGRMVGIVTEFYFGTLYSSAREISKDGWSLEDMISLCDTYPESDLIAWYSYEDILEMIAMTGGLDEYVDWENLTCSFDSEGFMNVLEKLTEIRYPENDDDKVSYGLYSITDEFLAQESLLANEPYIWSPYEYNKIKVNYGEWRIVGYPTVTGEEPWYQLGPMFQFGIYSNSENKEGAWAFIEFLLSEAEQTWYGYDMTANEINGFPARRDSFEAYLLRRYSSDASSNMKDESEKPEVEAEALKEMVEHARVKSYLLRTEIWDIILEEVPYYYEGAKSLEEVAGLIQNRSQLYLSEME